MSNRKYRGRREDNGRWVEGCYLLFTRGIDGDLHIIVDATGQYNRIELNTLGQCTGYLDTLGRLVYEGDIIKDEEDTYEVEYNAEVGAFIGQRINGITYKYLHDIVGEIIGNKDEVQTTL